MFSQRWILFLVLSKWLGEEPLVSRPDFVLLSWKFLKPKDVQ